MGEAHTFQLTIPWGEIPGRQADLIYETQVVNFSHHTLYDGFLRASFAHAWNSGKAR